MSRHEPFRSPLPAAWPEAALQGLDVGVVLVVAGRGVVFANEAAGRLLRMDLAALPGLEPGDLPFEVFDEDGTPVPPSERVLITALVGRQRVERTVELRWPDGRRVALVTSAAPVIVEEAAAAVASFRDVTEQHDARAELRRTEDRLQELMDGVDASVFVKDREGRYTFVNRAFAVGVGRQGNDIVGYTAADLRGVPGDMGIAESQDQSVLDSGMPVRAVMTFQGRSYLTTKVPLRDPDGQVVGVAGVSTDLTELYRADERAVRLAGVLEATGDAVVTFDVEGLVTGWNSAMEKLSALPAEDALGRSLVGPSHVVRASRNGAGAALPEVAELSTAELAAVLGGERVVRDVAFADPDASVGPRGTGELVVTKQAFPLRDDQGHIIGGAVVGHDVTRERTAEVERLRLQREIDHLQRLESLGQLAGGIAHDFNNLLAAVNLTAEMLQSDLPEGSATREQAGRIVEITQRAAELTAQLLVFARKDGSGLAVADVNAVVVSADDLLGRTLGEHITRRLDLVDRGCPVAVDPGRLEQVVVNLALNARDGMPGGGVLGVRTEIVDLTDADHRDLQTQGLGPHVVLTVSDEGEGMDEWTREQAFDPFFTTKPRGSGTGLGLAMVHGVARQAGGGARISSRPGEGTVVEVVLPLVTAPDGLPAATRVPVAPDPGALVPARVIVVEDEDALRDATCRLLDQDGYDVTAYADGMALLDAFPSLTEPPDLLLTDVVLPGLSGPEVAHRLQALVPGMAVLHMSGYTAGLTAHMPGDTEVLAKPFTAATLRAAVRRALGVHAGQSGAG